MIYYLHILSSSRTLKYFYRVFQRRVLARIANRLNNTQKSTKTYWPLLKIFLNNKKIRYGDRCIIDFKKKRLNFSILSSLTNGLCIKPGIQERGTECGESGEWGECYIPGNITISAIKLHGRCSTGFHVRLWLDVL